MNTKDQAIAWYSQTPKKTRVTQVNMEDADGWIPLFPRPAPDCRTCVHKYESENAKRTYCIQSIIGVHCTNGDKYQPAPSVVLWRTEP